LEIGSVEIASKLVVLLDIKVQEGFLTISGMTLGLGQEEFREETFLNRINWRFLLSVGMTVESGELGENAKHFRILILLKGSFRAQW